MILTLFYESNYVWFFLILTDSINLTDWYHVYLLKTKNDYKNNKTN